jgi:hypothetical protein
MAALYAACETIPCMSDVAVTCLKKITFGFHHTDQFHYGVNFSHEIPIGVASSRKTPERFRANLHNRSTDENWVDFKHCSTRRGIILLTKNLGKMR